MLRHVGERETRHPLSWAPRGSETSETGTET